MEASADKLSHVTIRMYRQGLGDAFLLGFHGLQEPRWALIDCGVVEHKDGASCMQRVAQDIAATTRDAEHPQGHLHRVIVSNTRWNHASGFVQAEAIFQQMAIDEIWLPATENQGNEQSHQRMRAQQKRLEDLRAVTQKLSGDAPPLAQSLQGVLRLFGGCDESAAAAPSKQSETALAALLRLEQTGARIRYLDALTGPQLLFPDLSAARVYTLGPRAENGPAGVGRGSATEQEALDIAGSFLVAAQKALGLKSKGDPQWQELLERNLPFPSSLQTTFEEVGRGKRRRKFKPDTHTEFFAASYFADNDWRRIDQDWMYMARGIALALDQDANNAGLALAFELWPSEKVLLFPGDAQLGTWKSWEALGWTVRDGAGERRLSARDLLRRTAVYKVAHHCSQTGTLIAGGLENMGRDMVALLPVNRQAARALKWDLPYAPLLQQLREKTKGRILISDPQEPRLAERPKPDLLTEREWQDFQQAARETDLYIEYTLLA